MGNPHVSRVALQSWAQNPKVPTSEKGTLSIHSIMVVIFVVVIIIIIITTTFRGFELVLVQGHS